MANLTSLWKHTSIWLIAMLAVGTCCLSFIAPQAHAMDLHTIHTEHVGVVITCPDAFASAGVPCASTDSHQVVATLHTSATKKSFETHTQNSTFLPLTSFFVLHPKLVSTQVDYSSSSSSFQEKTKWVTTLPRSHLS